MVLTALNDATQCHLQQKGDERFCRFETRLKLLMDCFHKTVGQKQTVGLELIWKTLKYSKIHRNPT